MKVYPTGEDKYRLALDRITDLEVKVGQLMEARRFAFTSGYLMGANDSARFDEGGAMSVQDAEEAYLEFLGRIK